MSVEQEHPDAGRVGRQERQRALEQVDRAAGTSLARRRASTPRGRPSRSPARARDLGVGPAELASVARRLLEVVADDLVELDQLARVRVEPVGEALVQLGARLLRQRVVRGVADQQVAEPERVVAGERRRRRAGSAPCARGR